MLILVALEHRKKQASVIIIIIIIIIITTIIIDCFSKTLFPQNKVWAQCVWFDLICTWLQNKFIA